MYINEFQTLICTKGKNEYFSHKTLKEMSQIP